MKKLLVIFISFFLIISNVNASVKTYSRNESNNYGVNKKWKLNNDRIQHALSVPYVDASEKIYDFSNLLTDEEEEELYKLMTDFIKHTEMDIVFISTDFSYYNDSANENYAADFYDYNDFGIDFDIYSGVLLFRNTYSSDPYFNIYTFGNAQLYFDYYRCEQSLDNIYYYFHDTHDYLNGVKRFVSDMTRFYDMGVVDKNLYVDEDGYIHEKVSSRLIKAIFTAFPVSGIATLIIILILVSKNKMIKSAYNAGEYIDRNSINFTDKRDVFISTHTSSYTHSSSSGGGGGHSGGSHSGSSGGGHGGGGGRHG